jgi:hypothetical protein
VFLADRLAQIWPDARFVFLLRHPGSIYQSWRAARPTNAVGDTVDYLRRFCTEVQRARTTLHGIDVRYENLVAEPENQTRRLCECLGIDWESGMVDYGSHNPGRYKRGLGDWSDNIRSGRPQPARSPQSPRSPAAYAASPATGATPPTRPPTDGLVPP